jgi:hypothetical protein
MRYVDRTAVSGPTSLLGANRAGSRELIRARSYYAGPPTHSGFTFAAYKGDDVRQKLEALFHGKCAYCEARFEITGPVDIEHFRPKGGVEGEAGHRGYWWLAASWTNLLPSCIDCNRRRYQATPMTLSSLAASTVLAHGEGFAPSNSGKECAFPLRTGGVRLVSEPTSHQERQALDAELPLLLNPCEDDPVNHLVYHIDRNDPLGLIFPASTQVAEGLSDAEFAELTQAGADAAIERDARHLGVSARGAASITVYGLNRLALVQERTRLLRRLEFLGALVIDLSSLADTVAELEVGAGQLERRDKAVERLRAAASRSLAEIRDMADPRAPFSTMSKQWIAEFTVTGPP